MRPRLHELGVEDRLARRRRAAHHVRAEQCLGRCAHAHDLDLRTELRGHPLHEGRARLLPPGVEPQLPNGSRRQHGAHLPGGLRASPEECHDGSVRACQQSGSDSRGGAGSHGGDRGAVEDRSRLAGRGVKPDHHRLHGGEAAIRIAWNHRDQLDRDPRSVRAQARHQQQVPSGDLEPGAHRRQIATSRHVPIGALDRVEQVGDRHSVLDRRPVEGRHPRLAHRVGV